MTTELIPNGHFRFTAVMEFEVSIEEAADILAVREHERPEALAALLRGKPCYGERCCNADSLAKRLGEHMAAKIIDERRMLTAPKGEAMPLEVA